MLEWLCETEGVDVTDAKVCRKRRLPALQEINRRWNRQKCQRVFCRCVPIWATGLHGPMFDGRRMIEKGTACKPDFVWLFSWLLLSLFTYTLLHKSSRQTGHISVLITGSFGNINIYIYIYIYVLPNFSRSVIHKCNLLGWLFSWWSMWHGLMSKIEVTMLMLGHVQWSLLAVTFYCYARIFGDVKERKRKKEKYGCYAWQQHRVDS